MTPPTPAPIDEPVPTPPTEYKSGGNIPTRVATTPAPRKKGLLDRLEDWLSRN